MSSHKKNVKVHIFFTSLIITILIFGTAMMLNYSLDFFRLGSILKVMHEHEISGEAFLTEESFIDKFGGNKCETMDKRVQLLKEKIKEVGTELSTYGGASMFRKSDYVYLERKYFLLELKFLSLIEKLNKECNHPYIPVIFFYETMDDMSERQGFILSELAKEFKEEVIVLSMNNNYEHERLVDILKLKDNITKSPTIIINNEIKMEGVVYEKELDQIFKMIIWDSDYYGSAYDFNFVIKATGANRTGFLENLGLLLNTTKPNFAKGDISLMMGRLLDNRHLICKSVEFYELALEESENEEEKAILYETIAAVGCKRNKKELLAKAAEIWRKLGNEFRADIDIMVSKGISPKLNFETSSIEFTEKEKITGASSIIIGKSSAVIAKNDILVSQTDRVSRDWLSYQLNNSPFSKNLLTVFSERLTYSEEELQPEIGWHEGGRIKQIKEIGVSHKIASGTVIAKHDGKWYAPDEKGVFRFEVPIDKVLYPTTRFLKNDIAIVLDTHGINMLVEQALRNKADFVVGCCDHPGKIKAAKYLAEKGVKVLCFTDKYLPLLIGTDYSVFGSPPIKHWNNTLIVGNQPISIQAGATAVAEDVANYSAVQSYYDTPARYFRELDKMADLDVVYVKLENMNSTHRVIEKAEELEADVIAVRIFNSDDYKKVKGWLEDDMGHKAVLFHSAPYPYGYKLINEFPHQTSFDDINPVFK